MRGTSTATGGGTSASHNQALVAARGINAATQWSTEPILMPEPWVAEALCAETDPEAFFPEKGGSTKAAKDVCAACDVAEQCLAYALRNGERYGIWGGVSERDRRKMEKVA